jgi:hypothetical protein
MTEAIQRLKGLGFQSHPREASDICAAQFSNCEYFPQFSCLRRAEREAVGGAA